MTLLIKELLPALGAEVIGVDLTKDLDCDTIASLRQWFDDRGVLVFRDLEIDRTRQYYLSSILKGDEPPSDEQAQAGATQQDAFYISNKEPGAAAPFGRLLFHSDGRWSDEPFEVISLYAENVLPPIVPTEFVSSDHAWLTLPEDLRVRVEGLHALHVTGPEYIHERRRQGLEAELSQAVRERPPTATTPVMHAHARTGRPLLVRDPGYDQEHHGVFFRGE